MGCGCHHLEPLRLDLDPPSSDSYSLLLVPNLGEKARSWPPIRQVEIDEAYWEKLNKTQRAALLAHEVAHFEKGPARNDHGGIPCEDCADRRAGAIMRSWGFGHSQTRAAAASIIESGRDAGGSYSQGWRAYKGKRRSG